MPEFYMILARKMPEFYIIIVRKTLTLFFLNFFFFGGGVPPTPLLSLLRLYVDLQCSP